MGNPLLWTQPTWLWIYCSGTAVKETQHAPTTMWWPTFLQFYFERWSGGDQPLGGGILVTVHVICRPDERRSEVTDANKTGSGRLRLAAKANGPGTVKQHSENGWGVWGGGWWSGARRPWTGESRRNSSGVCNRRSLSNTINERNRNII